MFLFRTYCSISAEANFMLASSLTRSRNFRGLHISKMYFGAVKRSDFTPDQNLRLIIRSCIAAFTPETASPSFFRTDFSCVLMRVFTLAVIVWESWNPGEAMPMITPRKDFQCSEQLPLKFQNKGQAVRMFWRKSQLLVRNTEPDDMLRIRTSQLHVELRSIKS